MSSSPMIVITNFFGTKVNAANTGVGFMNSDGTYNVSGTVIGLGQTAHSVVDFALTNVNKVSPWIPGVGAALGVLGASVSIENIINARADGESPAQADIAGAIGGVAAAIGGAALILGGSVIG